MTVAAHRPQVYSATLHLRTSFGVVAALMHTWFFTTAAVGVTLLMLMCRRPVSRHTSTAPEAVHATAAAPRRRYWLVVLVFELRDRLCVRAPVRDTGLAPAMTRRLRL